jgi:hypothetical protein
VPGQRRAVFWAIAGANPKPANRADANNEAVKSFDFMMFPVFVDELNRCLSGAPL